MSERPESFAGSAHVAADWAALATRADSAVTDYSRGVAAQLGVPRVDANRDDCDLTGHRWTELTPGVEAA